MPRSVCVAVVSLFGARELARCLDALAAQRGAPDFDVVVAHDPALADVAALAAERRDVRFVASDRGRTPVEVAACALAHATGDTVLLTEDHCTAGPEWVARMLDALRPGRAVVGGGMTIAPEAGVARFALYWVEFFAYAPPVADGEAATLSVCNAAYRREDLRAIAPVGVATFHETEVHAALCARGGVLWRVAGAELAMDRHVTLREAAGERFAFGRLFGATMMAGRTPVARAVRAAASLLLVPLVLALRMLRVAAARPQLWPRLAGAAPAIATLVLAWCAGEALGALTGRHGGEIAAGQRRAP